MKVGPIEAPRPSSGDDVAITYLVRRQWDAAVHIERIFGRISRDKLQDGQASKLSPRPDWRSAPYGGGRTVPPDHGQINLSGWSGSSEIPLAPIVLRYKVNCLLENMAWEMPVLMFCLAPDY